MENATVPSFMDAAIARVTAQKSTFGQAAALVERRNEEHWSNRIACAWADLVTERNQLRVLDLEDAGTRVKDMPVKPEMYLSLCQNLLNQSCWAARQYIRACQQNAVEEAIRGVSGIDFSQDVADDMGLEPMSTDEIEEALKTDFDTMQNLHSYLSKHMNYLQQIDELHLYAERQQEGEIWRITATADTFEEAEILMNEAVERMAERQEAELNDSATNTDFTDTGETEEAA